MGDAVQERLDRVATLVASSPHNLVARGDRPRLRQIHIDEAVKLAAVLPLSPGQRWLDLGTGGGLPGLVLAIVRADVRWVLVDSVAKKVAAVTGFAADLGLKNVEVVRGRAEVLAHDAAHRAAYDGVVSRGVALLPVLLELARGFLRDGGLLAAVKGPNPDKEIEESRRARHVLRYTAVSSSVLEDVARPTTVVTMRAIGSPPRGYPRDVGVPGRLPIGGSTA